MKTLQDLQNEFQVARTETQQAFDKFMSDRTVENFELYRESKYRRNELNALIQVGNKLKQIQ